MIPKHPFKFWEITQSTIISQKTTKAIIAAYKQKFGATIWGLFAARIDGRRRYLMPVVYGMLAQLLWVEENFGEPVVKITANEKMIYLAQLEEFTCEDTSKFHAYLGVFYAWWVDKFKSKSSNSGKAGNKELELLEKTLNEYDEFEAQMIEEIVGTLKK